MLAFSSKFFIGVMKKSHRGETLVELLVAIFILAITGTSTSALIIDSNRASHDVKSTFQARYLAREAFETLKMIRNTNWIRFADDKKCWDIKFEAKDCPKDGKESPSVLIPLGAKPRTFGLVMSNPTVMDLRLAEVVDTDGYDGFKECQKFDGVEKTWYAVYDNKAADDNDPYSGVMYSTDQTPPAESVPVYCRRVKLEKINADAIKVDVTVAWKVGSKVKTREESSYLLNY